MEEGSASSRTLWQSLKEEKEIITLIKVGTKVIAEQKQMEKITEEYYEDLGKKPTSRPSHLIGSGMIGLINFTCLMIFMRLSGMSSLM